MTQRRRRIRDLPLLWKLLLPFLALIVIFGAMGAFLIVRDLSSSAQAQLDQELARRSFSVRSFAHDRELYLVESSNFATNIQGMAAAIHKGDTATVRHLLGSVLVLKPDAGFLIATDTRGRGLVELRRASSGDKIAESRNGSFGSLPFVSAALSDASGQKHAGFLNDNGTMLLAIAAPICNAAQSCVGTGAIVVGTAIDRIAAEAAAQSTVASSDKRAGGGVAFYDEQGRLLAASGLPPVGPHTDAPGDGRLLVHRGGAGNKAATLFAPYEVQGRRVGSLAVTIPASSVFTSVRGTSIRLALIVLLVMAGVIGVGVLLSRFILAQLRPLVATNRALGRGDMTARAPVVSGDELGELAAGVNQMAEQLQASYETLELRVAQRTEEVRRLLDERTEFFAAVSHDLRTPLAVIRSQALMMIDPAYGHANPKEAAKAIVGSSEQLLALINELLEIARTESGRLEIDLDEVILPSVIKDMRSTIEGLARSADLSVRMDLPRDLPHVMADPRRIREVILNLVDNAVKYTPPGGSVNLSASAENGHVDLIVRDSGIGIPEQDRAKLFEPFYRVKGNAPQRGQASTGLGLALTKRLVDAQGGELSFSSVVGEGTTFVLRMPSIKKNVKRVKSK